jgi:DNA-binding PadR family transcriptional regulator
LQPGGIRPALIRLEEAGLIQRADASKRRRRSLSLTSYGKEFLESTWRDVLHDHPDAESLLRAACVALLMGDSMQAVGILEWHVELRQIGAEEKSVETRHLESIQKDPLTTYSCMRALCEAQRRSAEGDAFRSMGRILREKYQPDVDHK